MTTFADIKNRDETKRLESFLDELVRETAVAQADITSAVDAYHAKVLRMVEDYFTGVWGIRTVARGPNVSRSYVGLPNELTVTVDQFPLDVRVSDELVLWMSYQDKPAQVRIDLRRLLKTHRMDWRQTALLLVSRCYNEFEMLTFKSSYALYSVYHMVLKLFSRVWGRDKREGPTQC